MTTDQNAEYVRSSWRRVTAGRYELRGTNIKVLNMKSESVLWTGALVFPWCVYVGDKRQGTQFSRLADAKAHAETYRAGWQDAMGQANPPAQIDSSGAP